VVIITAFKQTVCGSNPIVDVFFKLGYFIFFKYGLGDFGLNRTVGFQIMRDRIVDRLKKKF
jgi:hypothetical protein